MRGQRPGDPDLRRITSNHGDSSLAAPLQALSSRESLTELVKSLTETDGNYAGTRGP